MSAALMIASLIAASAPATITVTGTEAVWPERSDVAYAQLARSENAAAITAILNSRDVATDDPAAMINLGAAYARLGKDREARAAYTRALASRERYELELADGSWMDSRRAARTAAALLSSRQTLALARRD